MRKLLIFLLAFILLFASASPAVAQDRLRVYYAGPEGGVRQALALVPGIEWAGAPADAQVIVLNGLLPPDTPAVESAVRAGAGLLLLMGPNMNEAALAGLLRTNPLPGGQLASRYDPLSLVDISKDTQPGTTIFSREVVWNSAPQVEGRAVFANPQAFGLQPLVVGYADAELVLGFKMAARGRVYVFTPFLNEQNTQFQEWAYFNYFIYDLATRAAGQEPLSFADYPASPLPHPREQVILYLMLAGALIAAVAIFVAVRRYSQAHPELLDEQVADKEEFISHEANTAWEQVGFHRPLGGFLVSFMLGLVLFIPLIIYQNLLLPVYILPSAQALGIWGRVTQFFNFLWLFFDMGTSAAFIKYFAEYRVHEPRKAILYGQVFVWWQALSGAVQVAVIAALASSYLPHTVYALYTWSIIIHTLIQIPGFYQVIRHSLMGWQRFDYAQILDLGLYVFFPMIAQPVIVTLMVAWGRGNPSFGPAMGGLIGLGLAAYACEALTFLLGLFLYRRIGYNARLLFLAHFDWATIKSSFRYGVFEMLGSVAWAVGQAAEIVITQSRLVNYTEIWGNWVLAQNFVFGFNVIQNLFSNLMPSISEAFSHARQALSQYYEVMAYKWGGLLSAFIGAVLLAVADRFILGASGPQFARAAVYVVPLVIWGAIQYPSWVGDTVQLGAGHPYLKAALVFGEQVVRVVLALLLLERFQINALIIAYFVGLLSKDIIAYFVNHRLCFPQRFFFWQSLGAPFLAGAGHYLILRWFTGLFWGGDQITSVLIFLIGILFSYPLCAFLYGLAGGWDDATLDDLRQAIPLSGAMSFMSRIFYVATAWGARFSPLHNRFPITIRAAAELEARSLTQERVDLV